MLILEMLDLILFTTKGCISSETMADKVSQVVNDEFLEQVSLKGKVMELNPRLCKEVGVADAPTLYCKQTKERLEGVHSFVKISSWINEQIIKNGTH